MSASESSPEVQKTHKRVVRRPQIESDSESESDSAEPSLAESSSASANASLSRSSISNRSEHAVDSDHSSSSVPIERSPNASLSEDEDAIDDAVERAMEVRCFSPRTRQSIGVGRLDLQTDSESDDESEIDESLSVSRQSVSRISQSFADRSTASGINCSSVEVPDSDENGDADRSHVADSDRSNIAEADADFTSNIQSSTMFGQLPADASSDKSLNATDASSDVEVVPNENDHTVVLSSADEEDMQPQSLHNTPKTTPKPRLLVQQKITAFTPKASGKTLPLKYVSAAYMAAAQKKRWELQTQLVTNKKLLVTLQHSLPDKGAALRGRIPQLEAELAKQDDYIASLRVEEDRKPAPLQSMANRANVVDDWSTITEQIDSIQPKHTGNQGLNTFNTQKALTVERLKQLHVQLETCPKEDVLADPPKGLRIELMDHQRYALAWMSWREKQKPRGGILADDMGLGKTLTLISLVLLMKQQTDDDDEEVSSDSDNENDSDEDSGRKRKSLYHGGTLVVCPASLINQWECEVQNRLRRNSLDVLVHHGQKREVRAKNLARLDIVITTYAIVARERKDRGALFGIKWARIILDEAHVIRNHKSLQSEACTKLRGSRRWSLTGTPIQNKEMDIYAQLRYLRCTPFDDLTVFKKWIGNQSTGNQERMNKVIQPMLLRRTKQQLQDNGTLQGMPSKTVHTVEVRLEKEEMNVYQRILSFSKTLFSQFLHQRAERDTENRFMDAGRQAPYERRHQPNEAFDRMHQRVVKLHAHNADVKSHQILIYILRLRQICCHPALIDAMLEASDGDNSELADASLAEVDLLEQLTKLNIDDAEGGSDANADVSLDDERKEAIAKTSSRLLLRTNPVFNSHRASSKFASALKILREKILPADEKAVVVSQWTSVLELFKEHLDAAGVQYSRLTGAVAVKDRNDVVVEFNKKSSGVRVMLLSLSAGGVGLNLIGGNNLLLLDPHWNPQLEAQAQDRVYRVGQTKPVNIYKFLCAETIEMRILGLQEKKMSMATDMLNGVKHTGGSKLTIDDMRALFEM